MGDKPKDCKRCKGTGWLKGHPGDAVYYAKPPKGFYPACPCTIKSVQHFSGDFKKQVTRQLIRYHVNGESVAALAEEYGLTTDQMKLRLGWVASLLSVPLRDAESYVNPISSEVMPELYVL